MPKVSVIITVYNIAQYLSEAIDSVLKQSFKDFEIIIVDDGSIDDTREVVNKYLERDLRINYIYQENKGPGAARNTGIKAAKGQYVAFLDGDDVLTQESLAERIALLERFSEVSFVYSDSIVQNNEQSKNVKGILEKKNFLLRVSTAIRKKEFVYYVFNEKLVEICVKFNFFSGTNAVMVKKKCFDEVGYFDTALMAGEDKQMWCRLMEKFIVGYVDKPLAVYKTYRSTLSKNTERYLIDSIKTYELFLSQNINKYSVRRSLKERVSDRYFDLGHYYYKNNSLSKARNCFLKSLGYNCKVFKYFLFLFLSCLPQTVLILLRDLRKRIIFKKKY